MKKEKKVVKIHQTSIKDKIRECIISSFILLFSFVIILLFSPIFDITAIEISGNSKVNENIIRSEAGINLGQNIMRLNKIKIKEDLLKVSYIDNVEIRRSWPDTILINVEEKAPAGKITLLGSNILIDENGYILEIVTDDKEYDVPLLNGIETTSMVINEELVSDNQELFENFLEILKNLKNNDMLKKVVSIEGGDTLILRTVEGHIVNIGDTTDLNYKLMRLNAIIDKNDYAKYYIDVSNINTWPTSKPLWD